MADYGSGIALDSYFDMQPDSSGDVASSNGVDELQKDLSFNLILALQYGIGLETPESIADDGIVGTAMSDRGALTDIEIASRKIVGRDDRIENVIFVQAGTDPSEDNYISIEVQATAITDDTVEFEFVVPAN